MFVLCWPSPQGVWAATAGHWDLVGKDSHGDTASVPVFVGFVSKGVCCAVITHTAIMLCSLHAVEWPPLLTTVMDSLLPLSTGHTLDTRLQHPANNSGHLPRL